jgi:hypothetical protein
MPPTGEWRAEDPAVSVQIRVVTSAGRGPESAPIKHRDVAAVVSNQTAVLQGTRRLGDADASAPGASGWKSGARS